MCGDGFYTRLRGEYNSVRKSECGLPKSRMGLKDKALSIRCHSSAALSRSNESLVAFGSSRLPRQHSSNSPNASLAPASR